MDAGSAGRALIVVGLATVLVGVGLVVFRGAWLRLPGDLTWRRGGVTVSFPLATCLLLSIALTLVAWLVQRLRR